MIRGAAWDILARLLALLHLAAAAGKLLDVTGFIAVLQDYRLFPSGLLPVLAGALIALEVSIAMGLAVRRWRKVAAMAAAGLAAAFLAVLSLTLARGIALDNCGCFGTFLPRPLTGWTLVQDAALLLLCVALARRRA